MLYGEHGNPGQCITLMDTEPPTAMVMFVFPDKGETQA
jgi:hypothetical protein